MHTRLSTPSSSLLSAHVPGGARIGLGLLSSPLRRALLFFTRLLLYVCIAILSHVHVYFKGWYRAGVFAPSTERELRSFFNHRSNKAVVVGNGAIVSIFGYRTRDHIVVSTANLQQVAEVQVTWATSVLTYLLPRERLRPSTQEDGTVRLQAGTTFKIALRELRSQNRSLALLPNYSHVTLGAALAVSSFSPAALLRIPKQCICSANLLFRLPSITPPPSLASMF